MRPAGPHPDRIFPKFIQPSQRSSAIPRIYVFNCKIENGRELFLRGVVPGEARRDMPETEDFSRDHLDPHLGFLEHLTKRILHVLDGKRKVGQGDDASSGAARLTSLGSHPSTGEDEGYDGHGEHFEDPNQHDDLAAGLLLDLAATTEPSTSMPSKDSWTGSPFDLTEKGKKRILRDDTRVRPPGRVTKLLDGHWPAIRMPDVLTAMECEDSLVLFARARYPSELGYDKLAANAHKLLNFHVSYHNTPVAEGLCDRMLASLNGTDRNESPGGVKALPEASILASFLKQHYGTRLKRSMDEIIVNSNSSDGPCVERTRTRREAVGNGVTGGSTLGGDGSRGWSEGGSGEGSDAHPSRKTRQTP